MPDHSLAEVVNALTPEQQSAVREFVEFLKTRDAQHRFRAAVD